MFKKFRSPFVAVAVCAALLGGIAGPFGSSVFAAPTSINALRSPVKPPVGGCIAKKTLTLYRFPNSKSAKVGRIAKGTKVRVNNRVGNWYKVNGGGAIGWTKGDIKCSRK